MRANNTLTVPEREILARRERSELRSWAAGRKAERQRIAQDLHDTLLQGFLSASLQLHVAVDRLPEDWPGKPQFRHILQVMRCVIDEGRSAIQGLRSSDVLDLEQAFLRVQWDSPRRFIVSGGKPSSTLIVTPSRPLLKRKSNMLLIDYSRQFAITDAESIKEYCGPGDPDIGVFREFVNARNASADGSESGASTSGPKSNYVSLGKSRFRKRPPEEANFRAREHSDDTNTYSG